MPTRPTIPTILTNTTLFRDWLNRINGALEVERYIYEELDTKAPIMHKSSGTLYGVANTTQYGHVKLIDTASSELNATNGTALTPKALYDANSEINTLIETSISEINASISDLSAVYAPIPHDSNTGMYGLGTANYYGHLKLSDTASSDLNASGGTAITPKALYNVNSELSTSINTINEDLTSDIENIVTQISEINDSIDDIQNELGTFAPIMHSTTFTTYGVGDIDNYGHLRINPDYTWPVESNSYNSEATAVSMKFISGLYSELNTSLSTINSTLSDLDERVEANTENLQNYSPIPHSSDTTLYGVGTDTDYGHLKITSEFSDTTQYSVDDPISVSAYAFSTFKEEYNSVIGTLAAQIVGNVERINELKETDEIIEAQISELDQRITDVENLPISYDTLIFNNDLQIDSEKENISTFICGKDSTPTSPNTYFNVELFDVKENYQFTVKNESDYDVKIYPELGKTIDNLTIPIVLGKYDSVTLKQNPGETINFTIISSNSTLSHSEYVSTGQSGQSITVSMSSRDANYFEIESPSVNFYIQMPTYSNDSNNYEFSEKIVVLHSTVDTVINYPNSLIWMNTMQKPVWGETGEILILKLLQIKDTVYATVMHNSQLVKDLDEGVKYSG